MKSKKFFNMLTVCLLIVAVNTISFSNEVEKSKGLISPEIEITTPTISYQGKLTDIKHEACHNH